MARGFFESILDKQEFNVKTGQAARERNLVFHPPTALMGAEARDRVNSNRLGVLAAVVDDGSAPNPGD